MTEQEREKSIHNVLTALAAATSDVEKGDLVGARLMAWAAMMVLDKLTKRGAEHDQDRAAA